MQAAKKVGRKLVLVATAMISPDASRRQPENVPGHQQHEDDRQDQLEQAQQQQRQKQPQQQTHSCQPSWNGQDSPGMPASVPVVLLLQNLSLTAILFIHFTLIHYIL